MSALTQLVEEHFDGVNEIFSHNETGLFTGQLSDIRFKVERIQVVSGSCDSFGYESCAENRTQYLEIFDQSDLSQYCLGYIFTYLDFHNGTAGLSTVGGACRPAQNSGFISLLNHGQDTPLNQSVIMRTTDGSDGLEFSNCSLVDMRRRLEEILTDSSLRCLEEDDEEPVSVSVCGNGLLEAGEQCDCGKDQLTCDDPCCYPAHVSPQERAANSSAQPCSRAARTRCITTAEVMYGLYIPVLFIFTMTVLMSVFLRHDWTRDKSLFKHVTEGNIRIVSQASRTWSARNREAATSVEQSRFK